jgi:hypothetical protein
MKLSELEAIIERAKSFGFGSEDIEVQFKKGLYTVMKVGSSEVCVTASVKGAKPLLTINLSDPSNGSYLDR